ncbi:hypothetical protein B5G06_01845 [Flavonifractor sp. An52]|uniref:hypothetical protein n=1 Tax=Flavonifractor sp. An52 TaxID=1965642 RepID=UPI000B395211|nr:hypothetical protein [Flavonifractor sp. An52]OUN85849.1 hypothetical protein B5G06_01845 [Flavonifractor sp. An52]
MERITEKDSSGRWSIPSEQSEAAAARLAAFENAYERLIARQSEIAAKMEALKAQGKQKTAQFRELFGEKLMNQNTLALWETYGVR